MQDLCKFCRTFWYYILFYFGTKWNNSCTIRVQELYFILFCLVKTKSNDKNCISCTTCTHYNNYITQWHDTNKLGELPWHEYSLWLHIPTRSWAVVHLMFLLFVPSSNRSLLSQELTDVSEKSMKSSAFVNLFFVSDRFSRHFVTDSNNYSTLRNCLQNCTHSVHCNVQVATLLDRYIPIV